MVLDGSNIVGQAEGYAVWPKNFQAFQAIVDAFDVVPKDSRQPPLKSKNLQREWRTSRIGRSDALDMLSEPCN